MPLKKKTLVAAESVLHNIQHGMSTATVLHKGAYHIEKVFTQKYASDKPSSNGCY